MSVTLTILLVKVLDEKSAQGRFDLEPRDIGPGWIQESPVPKLIQLEDDFFNVLDDRAVFDLAGVQRLFRPFAFDTERNTIGHRTHLLQDLFTQYLAGK